MFNQILMVKALRSSLVVLAALFIFSTAPANLFAQDEPTSIDISKVPATAANASGFVPEGWKIEEQVKGDVNGDGREDVLLKLVQDLPKTDPDGPGPDRARALIVVVKTSEGGWRNAAVADKLLQCTACGGAFYGVMDAPANVTIEKGVIVVSQDHGSREVTETTFRFRYDEQPEKFILIGFDYATRDRATGSVWTESTNYLTGKRITTTGKGKKNTTKTTQVAKTRSSIEEVDSDKFESDATHRLGLD